VTMRIRVRAATIGSRIAAVVDAAGQLWG